MADRDDISEFETLRREARAWVVRIRSGEATADDSAELIRWSARSPDHKAALKEAVRLRRLVAAAGLDEAAKVSGWRLSPEVPAAAPPSRAVVSRRAFLAGGLAASAAAGGVLIVRPPLGLWPSLAELRSDYRTGTGERRTIPLARGASAELNTRTSVALRSDDHVDRLELIAGEVAVDAIHPARPVAVRTAAGEASARDGRFSVRLQEGGACVTCLAGRVSVAARDAGGLVLTAGQQSVYRAGSLGAPTIVNVARAEAWRQGLLIFTEEPLSGVVDEINRYRPGKIILANASLGRIPVSAVFQLDRIDLALPQIRSVANTRVTALPGGVVLLS